MTASRLAWTRAVVSALPWVSSLVGWPTEFALASLHNHRSQFLKINLPLSPSPHIHTPYGCCLVTKLCPTLCDPMDCSLQAPLSMGFPRQESGVGCHFFLPGIFSAQGLNLHLLHWQADSLPLSHRGSQLRQIQGQTAAEREPWGFRNIPWEAERGGLKSLICSSLLTWEVVPHACKQRLNCLLHLLHWQTDSLPRVPPGEPHTLPVGSVSLENPGLRSILSCYCTRLPSLRDQWNSSVGHVHISYKLYD